MDFIKIPGTGKEDKVYLIRGVRVMIDRDLAEAFGVETKYLKRVVKRNAEVFSSTNLAFELSCEECSRCQIVTLNAGRGSNLKYKPYAFTEEGVRALAQVLKRQVEVDFLQGDSSVVEPEIISKPWSEGTVVLYQPNNEISLEVKVEDETVWLSCAQMSILFGREESTIRRHVNNVFYEKELEILNNVQNLHVVGVKQLVEFYSLDVIISVGYRVKSNQGTAFRRWANGELKNILLRRHYNDSRIDKLEEHSRNTDKKLEQIERKVNFFVRTNLPPVEGVFYDGQVFEAQQFASRLIEEALQSIILIDNYIDGSVLTLLDKRKKGVTAVIYTEASKINDNRLKQDVGLHDKEFPHIEIMPCRNFHDRFLIIDGTVYHIGASIKDLGKKLFAFSKMNIPASTILQTCEL